MSSGKTNSSVGYLSKIIERESRLQSKNNNNNILKPIQKPITPSNINTQINLLSRGGTEDTSSGEFQKTDKQQNHTPLISEIEEEVVSGSGFSSSSSSSFDIDQEDRKADDDMVNEKLRKRSVSGVVLAKGFDDTKSEEQTIKSSENIFKKPEQTKELKEEDFFGITTYHKDSNNYPTRGILSNAKEMNVSDYTENGDTRIGHYHDDDDERKIGDAEEVSTDIIQTKSLADSREEHQPRQKDNQKKENLEAQDTSNNLDKMGQTASGIKPTYKDNADESFLRRVNTFHNPGQHQDHDQAKIEFNKSDNVMMKKIGDADKINLRRTEEVSTDIIQTKSLVYSREEHQPRQKDNQKKENLEAQDTSNNLDKMGQTASGIKPTYKDNADESFLRRIMECVDNTTKLPQKHSNETRLTIGNINIQITNSSSNTVNNNSRNVNIKETTHDGNSADLAIWSNTFDKTYYWKFRYT